MKNGSNIRMTALFLLGLLLLIPGAVIAGYQLPIEEISDSLVTDSYYYGDPLESDLLPYVFQRWAQPNNSYLYDSGDGNQTLIEANTDNELITISKYDSNHELISQSTLDFELPLFGTFYHGENYNYIAYGQENDEEDDSKEVIRIVEYDQNFNRISSVAVQSCYTIRPFRSGCGRISESGNELVLHTSRLRYQTSDGLNHQSQLTICVNTDTMQVTNDIGQFQANHVSHSFDQYVQFDGSTQILIDHGDAYPRSIVLHQGDGYSYSEATLFDIPGETGANCTGVSVGGFEISSTSYLVAMNSIDHSKVTSYTSFDMIGLDRDQRDILLCVLPKGGVTANPTTLKKYVDTNQIGSVPKLVKIDENQFMVLWQEFEITGEYSAERGNLNYVLVDGSGNPIGSVQSISGYNLGESDPIVSGNTATWCTHENGEIYFYSLPVSGLINTEVTSFSTDLASGQSINTPITLSASASGTGVLRFEFTYTQDDSTIVIQDYSELNTVTFIPSQPGNYTLGVNVMDGNGNIASKIIEDFLIIGDTSNLPSLNYRTHVENVGWQDFVTSGQMSGTSGRGLRLEGIEIKIDNSQNALGIRYTTHVQNIGWQDMVENGDLSGTSGLGLRLEAKSLTTT